MNTRKIILSTAWLYEPSRQIHKVRDTQTNADYLLTKWGTFKITESDNKFVVGERVAKTNQQST